MATAAVLVPAVALSPAGHADIAPVPLAGAVVPTEEEAGASPVLVDEITPQAADEESTVHVKGRFSNTTGDTLSGVTVRLRYSSYPLLGREQLAAHAAGDRGDPQGFAAIAEVESEIPPGESTEFNLRVETANLGMSRLGVYPLAVEAVEATGARLGIQRTFLPYTGESELGSLDIAWIWPLMARPQRADDDTFLTGGLDEQLGPNGRLGQLLVVGAQNGNFGQPPEPSQPTQSDEDSQDEAAGDGGDDEASDAGDDTAPPETGTTADPNKVPLTWAIDPSLLADIQQISESSYAVLNAAGEGGDPTASSGLADVTEQDSSTNAKIWLEQARAIIGDDPLLATPYADVDLTALLNADLRDDAQDALSLGRETVTQVLERSADPSLAWPVDGVMNEETRDLLGDNGADTFVLSESALPTGDDPGVSGTAVPLSAEERHGEATALVADDHLSTLLGQNNGSSGEALMEQRFAAETAMIAAGSSGDSRPLVVAPPRDWNPAPEVAKGLLDASQELPWLDPTPLTEIQAEDATAQQRQQLAYPDSAAEAELGSGQLEEIKRIRREVRLFNSILADDGDPLRPAILRLESAAWREEEKLAARARKRVSEIVDHTMSKVRIMEGEPVTLASKEGTIPILVANDLSDHPVKIRLSVMSDNAERLSFGGSSNYTELIEEIDPGGKTTVYVPLTARVNGRTVLHMTLQNSTGEPLSEEEIQTPVNVTGLGNSALIISGGAALVLIIVLAPRAVRKWLRNRAGAGDAAPADPPEPAPEEDGNVTAAGDAAPEQDDATTAPAMTHNGRGPSDGSPSSHADTTGSDTAVPEESGGTDTEGYRS
ncbi:DUF6049 family protein [Salinactinospora qingdaonensis]|uniref:DUF6049 family protein n=2 Tax=Salinactinospora qingdaonensis TaxID=702744 RepID=A0ABP7F888_9ACTN